jgi:hypothetical protein
MWLVRHGVPFDLAFSLDDTTRTALCIIATEQNGLQLNWDTMQFEEPDR